MSLMYILKNGSIRLDNVVYSLFFVSSIYNIFSLIRMRNAREKVLKNYLKHIIKQQ